MGVFFISCACPRLGLSLYSNYLTTENTFTVWYLKPKKSHFVMFFLLFLVVPLFPMSHEKSKA